MRSKKPVRINSLLASLISQKKWQHGLRFAQLRLFWQEIVGEEIASRAIPVKLTGGRLLIHCEHDVWRTELNYLKPDLLKRISEEMGEGLVKDIYLR